MQKKYFGTDGVRGRVGEYPMNAGCILQLGWALGSALRAQGSEAGRSYQRKTGQPKVLIGKDTRVSGYMFESALEAGFSAAGVDIQLLGPMPTPGIAYLTHTLRADAGIVISASHNPYYDNGIKIFSSAGMKLPDALEVEIEKLLEQPMTTVDSRKLGKASRVLDAAGRYIEFCKSTVPSSTSLAGMKIVVDCANGAAYYIAPSVYRELGAEVVEIGTKPNGFNINQQVGSTSPGALQKRVLEESADAGIALDGDGDRVIMVDSQGEVVDGDDLLFIMAKSRLEQGGRLAGVVGTAMSNLGLELALRDCGVEFFRAPVGDRYVMLALTERDWILGGEPSGHIVCLDLTSTGDGIVSSLQVLRAMLVQQVSLHDLKRGLRKFPQVLLNLDISVPAQAILQQPKVSDALAQAEKALKGRGRVLVRPSGTEPVIRVMVEADDAAFAARQAALVAEAVERAPAS